MLDIIFADGIVECCFQAVKELFYVRVLILCTQVCFKIPNPSVVNVNQFHVFVFRIKLNDIEQLEQKGELDEHILTIDKMFPNLIKAKASESGIKKLCNGNVLFADDFTKLTADNFAFSFPELQEGTKCLMYNSEGKFMAIYRFDAKMKAWKAWKMFI